MFLPSPLAQNNSESNLDNFIFLESTAQNRMLSSTSETPSIANIMSKNHHPETSYPGSRVQNSNLSFSSVESNKYKIDGNGN